MIRIFSRATLIALAPVAALAAATPALATDTEIGYARGALAYEALTSAQLDVAEKQLLASLETLGNDPAVLINLGQLYQKTDRPLQALRAFEDAAAARKHFDVEMSDGRVVDSRQFARRQSDALQQRLAVR